jgi:hypothetical protein
MNVTKTLDTTYDDLLTRATNPRQRASLERIKAACDYLDANGLKISPTAVEKYCIDRTWDGPKAQSIRNSRDVLQHYVNLRHSGQKLKPGHSAAATAEPTIEDESLRAYVQLLKQERDQAVSERARIVAGLRTVPGIPVDELIRGKLEQAPHLPAPTATRINPAALAALRNLMDDGRLASCGLEVYKDRIRHAATRNVLLEKADVDALRSMVSEKG